MPNSFATPVLLMYYFVPELLSAVLGAQYNEKLFSSRTYEKALSPELGFLFHQMETLSENALLYPTKPGTDPIRARIGAWVPSNFLTLLSTMPEAEQLQILDGSPAAVDPPRRPEAFYRFLAYQLDKELSKNSDKKLLDSLHGIDFVSSNQFITGSSPPSHSTTRAMALDLSYDIFSKGEEKKNIKFGELLQHSLCRETRLRAWNSKSKAYETIVQRKIVTSLPRLLTIACTCAGRKEEDGLWVWRTDDGEPWLPEVVEVDLQDDGGTIVRQLKVDESSGEESWSTFKGRSSLPAAVSKLVSNASTKQKVRYQLNAVLSFVNDDMESSGDDESNGHHVLHVRVPLSYKKRILARQQAKAAEMLSKKPDPKKLVLTAGLKPEIFQKRVERAKQRLAACDEEDSTSSWVMYNNFAVSNTVVEDARAFHVSFKEPCLLVYRIVDTGDEHESSQDKETSKLPSVSLPASVMNARSLVAHSSKSSKSFNAGSLYEGKLLAFDAEFVSVQEEESTLLETGSKVVLRDTRHAVGRISIIDCETRRAVIDDHILPRERVIDYLTRFSGIVAEDLDPTKTTHNLISTRSAYLKLRYLMEQGCIFVGHGLRQDFATVNLVVPPNQVLDTVEIYHQPGMRYISLRFLANYVLKRDMQQDVHDSVEDAMAAFELYEKALQWKEEGVFDHKLQEIYSYGQNTDWKLGVVREHKS
jgi:PAB-dependent poly(A)-specific ribonuclease subunit 2